MIIIATICCAVCYLLGGVTAGCLIVQAMDKSAQENEPFEIGRRAYEVKRK